MHADFDDEITGLRSQVKQLRNVAQDMGTEAKFQKDFLDQLQLTMIKAQAGVKDNIRKLNQSIIESGADHVVRVVLFAPFCSFIVYLWVQISRR